ncbi:MAG: carboxypeptidase-like regulatory domain-containing protein [Cyclobacteriaceae bacterium]|nr:carboxypeptidase-like regulatory domain-containing protein [Cyclobacteriaceae bacterium]
MKIYILKHLNFLLFLFTVHVSVAQTVYLEGRVLDEVSHEPVPFPTFATETNEYLGIGNSNGYFYFPIDKNVTFLIVTCIGYDKKQVDLENLKSESIIIYMEPSTTMLSEVTVKPAQLNIKTVGIEEVEPSYPVLSFGKMQYSAFAINFNLKEYPVKILEAAVHIGKNEIGPYKLRCRVTESKNGYPDRDILTENVILDSDKEGWVKFDLSEFRVWTSEKKIFLIIEILQDFDEKPTPKSFYGSNTPGFTYVPFKKSILFATSPNNWSTNKKFLAAYLKVGYIR